MAIYTVWLVALFVTVKVCAAEAVTETLLPVCILHTIGLFVDAPCKTVESVCSVLALAPVVIIK